MFSKIPTIDLQSLSDNNLDGFVEVAKQLKSDFAQFGFAYLVNHGIEKKLIETIFDENKRFHALPLEEKLKIKINDSYRGYMPNKSSQAKVSTEGAASKANIVDSFVMMFEADPDSYEYKNSLYMHGANQWPDNLPNFKENVCVYRDAMLNLSYKLLKAFALAFDATQEEFQSLFKDPTYFLRLQHYEPQPANLDNQFGFAPHTDAGLFTILAQDDTGGLDARADDIEWVEISPIPDTLVLNTGVLMSVFTNDQFKAAPHRVRSTANKHRYSIPFLFEPNINAKINRVGIYRNNPLANPLIYKEHIMDRIQGNYGVGKRS